MTEIIIYSFLILTLLVIVFQDIKHRRVHIAVLALLFILSICINYNVNYLTVKTVLYNISFVIINIVGVVIYYSIKNKRFFNPIDTQIGLGDIVFFIAITPLFKFKSFMLFFIIGLIASLVIHLISNYKKKQTTIPLAGYLSLCLIVIIFAKTILNIDNSLFNV